MDRLRRLAAHPAVKAAYFLILVAATLFYLVRWGDQLPELLSRMQPRPAAAGLAMTVVAGLLYSFIQYTLYRRLGARMSYGTTFRIIAVAQLGKYLPGKVMFAGNYYLLSREAGVSNTQVGTSFVVSQALWMLTACLCGLPVLALLDPVLRYSLLLVPLALALLIHPRFLRWLLRLGQRLVGRAEGQLPPLPERLSAGSYLWLALLYLLNWGAAGLGSWLCLQAFAPVGTDLFPLALAAVALGTIAGFVALFAPVGLGIREGLGAVILAPALGADVALLGLILLRGITVAVDLLFALVGLSLGARRRAL